MVSIPHVQPLYYVTSAISAQAATFDYTDFCKRRFLLSTITYPLLRNEWVKKKTMTFVK